MLLLKENEVCPHSYKCPYHNPKGMMSGAFCRGADRLRKATFTCSFVQDDGTISDGYLRNQNDVTGRMKILVEGK
jgi:hypothetical protein